MKNLHNRNIYRPTAHKLVRELGIRYVNRYLSGQADSWKEGSLSLWREDAASLKEFLSYIRSITMEGSPDYIPPEDRIAVFDMDGTLFCETDPTFFDFRLFYYRVMVDPDYKERRSKEELALAESLEEYVRTGVMPDGFESAIGNGVAHAFSGMTMEEFEAYVHRFGEQPALGYSGMKQSEAFYKPMLQILDLLKGHEFTIFICSGTDRQVVRSLVDEELRLPLRQVLGTEEVLVARDQGSVEGIDYVYTSKDELIFGGRIQGKNLKMNKVAVIAQEIGQQPVLCFGNSAGDASMANYVTSNNPYSTKVFMICCDDLERENGNLEKAARMRQLCEENGWVPVSMREDWKTIYGEGVTKKKAVPGYDSPAIL